MPYLFSASERRKKLNQAQLMLIFTPQLVQAPMDVLAQIIGKVDAVQVRPKGLGAESGSPSSAKECVDWANRVLKAARPLGSDRPLILVNDRVDVAKSLLHNGVDGCHLGQDDTPWQLARELLGPDALIGLSTHSYEQVRRASDTTVDYLGFGPVFPTSTKGLHKGNQSVQAWVASDSSPKPIFPIGGITEHNAWQLSPIGRAAVASGVMCVPDPVRSIAAIRQVLTSRGSGKRQTP